MTYIIILLSSLIWQPINDNYLTNNTHSTVNVQQLSLKRAKKLTPLSEEDLLSSLKDAHLVVFGKEPSRNRLSMGWAQVSFENGRGDKIYNFNFGNIGASKKEPHFYISRSRFRANDSAQEGAVRYWKHLKERCNSVLVHFDAGDAVSASYQLQRCGYYRCDKDHYARNLKQLFWDGVRLTEKENE